MLEGDKVRVINEGHTGTVTSVDWNYGTVHVKFDDPELVPNIMKYPMWKLEELEKKSQTKSKDNCDCGGLSTYDSMDPIFHSHWCKSK